MEDLMQEARRGFLFAASEKWKPGGGASVTTYCMYWADKFIQREVETAGSTIRVPGWAHSALTASRSDARQKLAAPLSPTIRQAAAALRTHSLDLGVAARSGKNLAAMGLIDLSAADLCDHLARMDIGQKVLAYLSPIQRAIVVWRYVDEMSLASIAVRLKEEGIQGHLVSRQRICAILRNATKRIRFWLDCHNVKRWDVL